MAELNVVAAGGEPDSMRGSGIDVREEANNKQTRGVSAAERERGEALPRVC
jgi:hypothetical protein